MDIHEYQAKIFLKKYNLPIPPFAHIKELSDIPLAIQHLNLTSGVLKVQVHAGGRGKAGGVIIAKTPDEILKGAEKILKMKIVNNQTGKEGVIAHELLLSPLVNFEKEFYLGIIVDRKKAKAMLIASPEGGMDIEEIAHQFPEKIQAFPIENRGVIRSYHLLEFIKFMGWNGKTAE